MSGLEGICPKCGFHYYGWALSNPLAQKCGNCGSALEIKRDNVTIPSGLSSLYSITSIKPLTAKINP